MVRPVDDVAITFIEKVEGRPPNVYKDSAGYLTGGYGHRLSRAEQAQYPEGTPVDDALAQRWLAADLGTAALRLASCVKDPILTQVLDDHQYSALVSFVFNVGANPKWQIWRVLNSGQLAQVPDQLMRFDKIKVGGKAVVLPGLEHRRMAERSLWNTPDVEVAAACANACPLTQPSSYYADQITPPTPSLLPANFVTSAVAKAGTVVGSVGSGVGVVQAQIAPHADVDPIFHTATVICIGVTIACGTVGLALSALQKKESTT